MKRKGEYIKSIEEHKQDIENAYAFCRSTTDCIEVKSKVFSKLSSIYVSGSINILQYRELTAYNKLYFKNLH